MFLLISVWFEIGWHGRNYLDWFHCFCRSGDDEGKAEQWVEAISWEPRAFIYHNFLVSFFYRDFGLDLI